MSGFTHSRDRWEFPNWQHAAHTEFELPLSIHFGDSRGFQKWGPDQVTGHARELKKYH